MSMAKLDQLYRDAFGWDQSMLDCVHLALGCYLAPRWPGRPSPAWAAIVGMQSGGKSTIIGMFEGLGWTVAVDNLTRNAMTSCFTDEDDPERDHSFFAQLAHDRTPVGVKVWLMQELSTFLSEDPLLIEKNLAAMRAASVGSIKTHGGMGGTRVRQIGAFGLIVGTTEAFEVVRSKMSTFGDRFLAIRMHRRANTPEELVSEATNAWSCDPIKQAEYKTQIRDETHKLITRGVEAIDAGVPAMTRTPADQKRLAAWAAIHGAFATGPLPNGMLLTAAGKPYRIVEQVKSWGDTHALMDGRSKWNESEMRVARRIFQDSMPRANWDALAALWPNGCTSNNIDLYRQWEALGAVEAADGSRIQYGRDREIRLTPAFRQLIEGSGYFDGA